MKIEPSIVHDAFLEALVFDGAEVKLPIAELVRELTGCMVRRGPTAFRPQIRAIFVEMKTDGAEEVPEAILHELCHWIVATDAERTKFNLGLFGLTANWREWQACAVQVWIEDAAGVDLKSYADAPRIRIKGEIGDRRSMREKNAARAYVALMRFEEDRAGTITRIVDALRASLEEVRRGRGTDEVDARDARSGRSDRRRLDRKRRRDARTQSLAR